MKVFLARFSRAESAIENLEKELRKRNLFTRVYSEADYFLLSGDRSEMFDFAVKCLRDGKKIIHLWAGECEAGWSTEDECYRTFITLSSCIQLCTNDRAVARVVEFCRAVDKKPNPYVVGNVMLDNLETNDRQVPEEEYSLILYNPPTLLTKNEITNEIAEILKIVQGKRYIWIEPNGDKYSELIQPFVTHFNFEREEFLGLVKNCKKFITNSSCQFYEAPFLMDKGNIISIGKRNSERESKYADMKMTGATENIIKILETLE